MSERAKEPPALWFLSRMVVPGNLVSPSWSGLLRPISRMCTTVASLCTARLILWCTFLFLVCDNFPFQVALKINKTNTQKSPKNHSHNGVLLNFFSCLFSHRTSMVHTIRSHIFACLRTAAFLQDTVTSILDIYLNCVTRLKYFLNSQFSSQKHKASLVMFRTFCIN